MYLCLLGHQDERQLAVGDDNYCTVIVSGLDFIRVKLYIRTCLSVIRPTFNDKVVSINDKVVCGCHFITITIKSDPLLSQEHYLSRKYRNMMIPTNDK